MPHERFEAFFRAEHARLFRALYLVTGSVEEAEDLMQQAFLSVWERWDRVGSVASPTGYLYRTAMDGFRSRRRRAVRAARRMVPFSSSTNPYSEVDERDWVVRALAMLAPRQRAALVATEFLGYGSEEAAELLGVKPVTVRVLVSQARASLRRSLEPTDA